MLFTHEGCLNAWCVGLRSEFNNPPLISPGWLRSSGATKCNSDAGAVVGAAAGADAAVGCGSLLVSAFEKWLRGDQSFWILVFVGLIFVVIIPILTYRIMKLLP